MGMFDSIKLKVDLPFSFQHDHKEHWFQTKSLDCLCDYYEVREDKTLWLRAAADQWIPSELTGGVTFYTFTEEVGATVSLDNKPYPDRGWVEFSAYFVKGKLIRIDLVYERKPS